MALPNPSMSFSPFAILTADEMNDLAENDQALAAGTGLDNSAVVTTKIASAAVTPVKWTNPYKFSVYRNSTYGISATTWTKVNFETELFDTNSNFDSTTNYRYTAPVSGYYQFDAQVGIGSSGISTTAVASVRLRVNGTTTRMEGNPLVGSGNSLVQPRCRVDGLVQLTAGDYVEIEAYCSEASRDVVGASHISYFTGFLVSQT